MPNLFYLFPFMIFFLLIVVIPFLLMFSLVFLGSKCSQCHEFMNSPNFY